MFTHFRYSADWSAFMWQILKYWLPIKLSSTPVPILVKTYSIHTLPRPVTNHIFISSTICTETWSDWWNIVECHARYWIYHSCFWILL